MNFEFWICDIIILREHTTGIFLNNNPSELERTHHVSVSPTARGVTTAYAVRLHDDGQNRGWTRDARENPHS